MKLASCQIKLELWSDLVGHSEFINFYLHPFYKRKKLHILFFCCRAFGLRYLAEGMRYFVKRNGNVVYCLCPLDCAIALVLFVFPGKGESEFAKRSRRPPEGAVSRFLNPKMAFLLPCLSVSSDSPVRLFVSSEKKRSPSFSAQDTRNSQTSHLRHAVVGPFLPNPPRISAYLSVLICQSIRPLVHLSERGRYPSFYHNARRENTNITAIVIKKWSLFCV